MREFHLPPIIPLFSPPSFPQSQSNQASNNSSTAPSLSDEQIRAMEVDTRQMVSERIRLMREVQVRVAEGLQMLTTLQQIVPSSNPSSTGTGLDEGAGGEERPRLDRGNESHVDLEISPGLVDEPHTTTTCRQAVGHQSTIGQASAPIVAQEPICPSDPAAAEIVIDQEPSPPNESPMDRADSLPQPHLRDSSDPTVLTLRDSTQASVP